MSLSLIDSHCHPPAEHGNGNSKIPDWLIRSREAGVDECIAIGTDSEDWGRHQKLAARFPDAVHWTVGLHPSYVGEDYESQLSELPQYLDHSTTKPVCALGEIGLDFTRLPKDRREETIAWQMDAFRRQIELAANRNLAIVIHSRGTIPECLQIIDETGFPPERTIFHCFSEGRENLEKLRAAGANCSFTGIITFKNAKEVREALEWNGLDNLILETDSPYLSPEPFRGKPNEPARVAILAQYCADFFGVTPEKVAAITRRNTKKFFGLE